MNEPIRHFFLRSLQLNYDVEDAQSAESLVSICAAALFIGLMLSFIVMGKLMDGLGRKQTILLRSFLGIIGSALMLTAQLINRFELFIIGHFISGFISGLRVVLIIWMAECSPDSKRGLTSLAINSGGVLMVLLVTPLCLPFIFGNDDLWIFIPCVTALLAATHLVFIIFLPQSPKQLFIRNRDEQEARKSLRFYYGDNCSEIDDAICEMIHESKQAELEKSSILNILQHETHRFSFFLVFICSLVPVFSGLNIKSQYLVEILISFGLEQSQATIALMAISIASLPISLMSPVMIEKYGRRPIFVILTWLCALEWIGFAIAQAFVDLNIVSPLPWIIACFASVLGQSALNMGMLVMAPIMISELCPHNIRAAVSQYTQVPPITIAVLEVLMFPILRSSFGAALFLFLSTCCAALAVILQNQMLETAGLAVDEIVCRLKKQHTLHRSNTSVGWMHYGSMWEDDLDPREATLSSQSKYRKT
ncbi:unnamed protein product [Caenorhabditis bovis]|uniref:Major facilitator superfamily (MFS) profile domain-containing protein n=1 Tax=Caenorhabditis bovis TaxID=2654633 RepID=A0A8S1DZ05_9PELO|nr:unnamed protein product [Caenorhabditis bovis]